MSLDPKLRSFVRQMPKVELHVHLEGSIRPATLLQLASRHRVDLPADTEEGLRRWFCFRDFEHFVRIYLTCCRCLRDPEDFQLVMREFLAEQERQNVLYSEVHFTIGTHLANGVDGGEVAVALFETLTLEERRRGVSARVIPDIVRDVEWKVADKTLEWALDGRDKGVVALGLSGFESSPSEPFQEHFLVAAREGLHRVAHAGEHEGPASVRSALEVCEPERIGHGIRSIEDAELIAQLRERCIPLEVCPSSNVCLGAVPALEEHPFERLRQAGVQLSVNSDDPPLFDTSLTEEYLRLSETFGYDADRLASLSWAALRHAFLPEPQRQALEAEFRSQFVNLGDRLLGAAVEVTEIVGSNS